MSVVEKYDIAVEEAILSGVINERQHGAAIEAARKVAMVMDDPEWPIVRSKIDNVSPSVFLKYCEQLGLVPNVSIKKQKEEKKDPEVKDGKSVVDFRKGSRYAKKSIG